MALQTTQVASLSGVITITVTYDDVDGRVRSVTYNNPTIYPVYVRFEPVGIDPVTVNLPANTTQTITLKSNERPLYDIPMSMGFAERS